jgi:hypothetical protein
LLPQEAQEVAAVEARHDQVSHQNVSRENPQLIECFLAI